MEVLLITALVAAAGTAAVVALPLVRRRGGKNRTRTSDVVDWEESRSANTKTKTKAKANTKTKTNTKTKANTKTSTHIYEDPALESKFKEQLAQETEEIKALTKLRNELTLDPPKNPEELVAHNNEWDATLARLSQHGTRKSKSKKTKRTKKYNNNNGFNEGAEANQYKMKFRRATRKRSMRQ